MGTNFYIRRTKPREVYDEYHIAKTSCGWPPIFEAYMPSPYDKYDDRPAVNSVDDIKALIDSGDFILVDENDQEYDWEDFTKRVLEFGDSSSRTYKTDFRFKDNRGYEFLIYEFC